MTHTIPTEKVMAAVRSVGVSANGDLSQPLMDAVEAEVRALVRSEVIAALEQFGRCEVDIGCAALNERRREQSLCRYCKALAEWRIDDTDRP